MALKTVFHKLSVAAILLTSSSKVRVYKLRIVYYLKPTFIRKCKTFKVTLAVSPGLGIF